MSVTLPDKKTKKAIKALQPSYSEMEVKLMMNAYGKRILQEQLKLVNGKKTHIYTATEFYDLNYKK